MFSRKKGHPLVITSQHLVCRWCAVIFLQPQTKSVIFLSLCHPQFHGVYQNQNKVLKINLKARRGEFFEAWKDFRIDLKLQSPVCAWYLSLWYSYLFFSFKLIVLLLKCLNAWYLLSLLSRVVYEVDAFHAVMAVQWESFKTNKFAIKDIATMKCFSAKILKQWNWKIFLTSSFSAKICLLDWIESTRFWQKAITIYKCWINT